jgi:hypothetical protein
VTWLYGPLIEGHIRLISSISDSMSQPETAVTSPDAFLNQRPVTRQRSVSGILLQRSISTSSRLKRAAAVVEAQQLDDHKTANIDAVPILSKRMSLQTSNSTLTTPFPGLSGIVALHPKAEKTVRFTMVSSATSSNRDPWSSSGWVEEEDDTDINWDQEDDGDIVPKTELIDDVADFIDTKESEATSSTSIAQVKQPRGRPRKHPQANS